MTANSELPDDQELARIIRDAEGRKGKERPDPTKPAPRLPEAIWYSLFIMAESLILMGVWAFMLRGPQEVLKGPGLDAPFLSQVQYHAMSVVHGMGDAVTRFPLLLAVLLLASLSVFLPPTPRARKRLATLISTLIVIAFMLLIGLQFTRDMAVVADPTRLT
jgi:hypothetical protein